MKEEKGESAENASTNCLFSQVGYLQTFLSEMEISKRLQKCGVSQDSAVCTLPWPTPGLPLCFRAELCCTERLAKGKTCWQVAVALQKVSRVHPPATHTTPIPLP